MGTNKIKGTANADNLLGTSAKDLITGVAGDDTLSGAAGDDTLDGGTGDDSLLGGDGNDSLIGGDGSDRLFGDAGNDRLDGGVGNDTLNGGAGNDRLLGGAGQDVLIGGDGNDTYVLAKKGGIDVVTDFATGDVVEVSGFKVKDLIFTNYNTAEADSLDEALIGLQVSTSNGETLILGEFFRDNTQGLTFSNGTHITLEAIKAKVLTGGAGNDTIFDTYGNDSIGGGAGNDTLKSFFGVDTQVGGDGDDSLNFDNTASGEMNGGAGNDTLSAWNGNDKLSGGDGNDEINAFGGNDLVDGGTGIDLVYGGAGNDSIDGGAGNDILIGGIGDDRLLGGAGDDTLDGGTLNNGEPGNDTFVLAKLGGHDTVTTFEANDILELSGFVASDLKFTNYNTAPNGTDEAEYGLVVSTASGESILLGDFFQNNTDGLTLSNGTHISMEDVKAQVLGGTAGNDLILDTQGDDNISGEAGNDTITSFHGIDSLQGGDGNDTLSFKFLASGQMQGGAGNDTLTGSFADIGGTYSDTLDGGEGNDTIEGRGGNDSLVGGDGNDLVVGDWGDDTLRGGDGDDTINGAGGDDRLYGGNGADVFLFDSGSFIDTILAKHNHDPYDGDPIQFEGNDKVLLGSSLNTSNVQLNIVQLDILDESSNFDFSMWNLELSLGEDTLVIENYLTTNPSTRGNIEFSDGTVWDYATVKSMVATDVDTIAFDTLWL